MHARRPRSVPGLAVPLAGVFIVAAACGMAPDGTDTDIDSAAVFTGEEELRIGSVDDPERGFTRIASMDVAGDGRMFIGEAQDVQIRVYSPDGRLLQRIGRRGAGPGEFEDMPRFGVKGDTLWAYDQSAGRITLFDTNGNLISTGPTRGEPIVLSDGRHVWAAPYRMRDDGHFISNVTRISYTRDHDGSGLDPDVPFRVPRLVFDASGTVLDTAGWDASPPPRMVPPPGTESEYRSISAGGRSFMVPPGPSALPHWIALDDGRMIIDLPFATTAEAGAVHVTRLDLAGDTVWHRTFDYQPVPYAPEELDSAAARTARGANVINSPNPTVSVADAERIARQIRAEMDWPEYRQPFTGGWVAADGALWLARGTLPGEPAGFFVIEADGASRGSVELPARARVMWARGDTVWAAVPDELDVQWLVKYRLQN